MNITKGQRLYILLIYIQLLFLKSSFSLPQCSSNLNFEACTDTGTITFYCIKKDKIYGLKRDNADSCIKQIQMEQQKINGFDLDKGEIVTNFCNGSRLSVIYCHDDICSEILNKFSENDYLFYNPKNYEFKKCLTEVHKDFIRFTQETGHSFAVVNTFNSEIYQFSNIYKDDSDFESIKVLTEYSIFDCYDGICEMTMGYLKYNGNSNEEKQLIFCVFQGCDMDYYENDKCETEMNIGLIKADHDKIKVCTIDENNHIGFKSTDDTNVFFVRYADNYLLLLMTNDKNSIIGFPIKPMNFLIKNYEIVKDIKETEGKIIRCIDNGYNSCTFQKDAGYYINNGEVKGLEAPFIKCDRNMVCSYDYSKGTTCNTELLGQIITENGKLKLCIYQNNTPKAIPLTKDANDGENVKVKNYLFNYFKGNIFGLKEGQSGILRVDLENEIITMSFKIPGCIMENNKCQLIAIENTFLKPDNYCFQGNDNTGKIYKGNWDGTCSVVYGDNPNDEGLIVFDVSDSFNVKKVDLTDKEISLKDRILEIYECGYGKCHSKDSLVIHGQNVYERSSYNFKKYIDFVSSCDKETSGKLLKESTDMKDRGSETVKLCLFEHSEVKNDEVLEATFVTKNVNINSYYDIGYHDLFESKKFIFNTVYSRHAHIRVENNIIVLSSTGLQLPSCDFDNNGIKCKINGVDLKEDQVCLNDGKIYKIINNKECQVIYGGDDNDRDSSNGIKIFQKLNDFNSYKDVTHSMESISINPNEITPYFAIYDCCEKGCIQSGGYIKYKTKESNDHSGYNFLKCYPPRNDSEEYGCHNISEDLSNNHECTLLKSYDDSYIYSDEDDTLKLCYDQIVNSNTDFKYNSFEMKEDSNGYCIFNSELQTRSFLDYDHDVLVKINHYSIAVAHYIKKGYYINSFKSYINDKEIIYNNNALIYCPNEDEPSYCEEVSLLNSDGYYLNSGNRKNSHHPFIHCHDSNCSVVDPHDGYYYISDDFDNNKPIYGVYRCLKRHCEKMMTTDSCIHSKIGGISESIDHKMYFCISNNDEDRIEISQTIPITFITLSFKNGDEIPLTNTKANHDTTILIKIENNQISIVTDGDIYINKSEDRIATEKEFRECAFDTPIIKYTISSNEIISTVTCNNNNNDNINNEIKSIYSSEITNGVVNLFSFYTPILNIILIVIVLFINN